MENLGEALGLLLTGVIMVVIVLWLVVSLGNLIINLTNKYIKDEKPGVDIRPSQRINTRKVAAIAATVDVITQGRGRVDSIQKK